MRRRDVAGRAGERVRVRRRPRRLGVEPAVSERAAERSPSANSRGRPATRAPARRRQAAVGEQQRHADGDQRRSRRRQIQSSSHSARPAAESSARRRCSRSAPPVSGADRATRRLQSSQPIGLRGCRRGHERADAVRTHESRRTAMTSAARTARRSRRRAAGDATASATHSREQPPRETRRRHRGAPQPQRHVRGLHRVGDHAAQVLAERLEVELVAQPAAERLQRPRRVVAAAVEAPVHAPPGCAPAPGGTAPRPRASTTATARPDSPDRQPDQQHERRGRWRRASLSARRRPACG